MNWIAIAHVEALDDACFLVALDHDLRNLRYALKVSHGEPYRKLVSNIGHADVELFSDDHFVDK